MKRAWEGEYISTGSRIIAWHTYCYCKSRRVMNLCVSVQVVMGELLSTPRCVWMSTPRCVWMCTCVVAKSPLQQLSQLVLPPYLPGCQDIWCSITRVVSAFEAKEVLCTRISLFAICCFVVDVCNPRYLLLLAHLSSSFCYLILGVVDMFSPLLAVVVFNLLWRCAFPTFFACVWLKQGAVGN